MDKNQVAYDIIRKYYSDEEFKSAVDASPEFYRACVYESGLVGSEELNGIEDYLELVDILERGFFWVQIGIEASKGK